MSDSPGTVEIRTQECGVAHPRKARYRCSMPAGHSTVMVGSIPFDHFDARLELAWRLT